MTFLANYRYNLAERLVESTEGLTTNLNLVQNLTPFMSDSYSSDCSGTMIGVMYDGPSTMRSHSVKCYFAEKESSQSHAQKHDSSLSMADQIANEVKDGILSADEVLLQIE